MTFSLFGTKCALVLYAMNTLDTSLAVFDDMNTLDTSLAVFVIKILNTSGQHEKLFLDLQNGELHPITKSCIHLALYL